ncbi:MAG TPA: hypothetical protein VI362_00025 [Ignavibacteriaceae bacterium]|nr:hypothetical protein [Ignavibacteriaceae bacterium]
MSFLHSIDSLVLIKTWLIIIGIIVGLVWGLLMIYWEAKKKKSLKGRIILSIIAVSVWGTFQLIIDVRINDLEDEKKAIWGTTLEESKKDSKHFKSISDSLKRKLDKFGQEFGDQLGQSESLRILSEQELKNQLHSTNEELNKTKKIFEPRGLTIKEQDEMIKYLSLYPKGEITFQSMFNDVETYNFAKLLSDIFTKAGYKVLG